jgi:predicted branched-subunit amino acid permease
VDFALTSLFIVLLIEQLKSSKDALPAILGGIFAVAAVAVFKLNLMASSNIIWTSIVLSLGVLLILRGPKFFEKEKILSAEESK